MRYAVRPLATNLKKFTAYVEHRTKLGRNVADRNSDEASKFQVVLTSDELEFLDWGLRVWDGLAYPPSSFMHSLGYLDGWDLVESTKLLRIRLSNREPLTRIEWTTVLVLSEVGFSSDVLGAGLEWWGSSDISDSDAIQALRSIQNKLIDVRLRYARYSGDLRE